MDPIACAVPLARNVPAAPADTAGRAGIDPTVIRIAEITPMVVGYSTLRSLSASHARSSHTGTSTADLSMTGRENG